MRTRYALFALCAMFLASCAGMTAAETTGAIAATTGVLSALAEAIVPYLPPEKQAEVIATMNTAQGLMNAVTTAMGSVAQAAAEAKAQSSQGVTGTELAAGAGAATVVGTAASRMLSLLKHGTPGKPAKPA